MPLERPPVEPTDLIVLTIGIVVPALRAPDFVAHEQHWRTESEQRQHEEVLDLPITQGLDGWIISRSFHAAIPADVEVGPVPVVLSVRLVVLLIVRDQVVERESV